MATLNAFNDAMRPVTRAYDTAVAACVNPMMRDAKRRWEEAVESLRYDNQPPDRPLAEIELERKEALRTYEQAIYASGDDHVIETWRMYRATLQTATDTYARGLR